MDNYLIMSVDKLNKEYHHYIKCFITIIPSLFFDQISILYFLIGYIIVSISRYYYYGYLIGVTFTMNLNSILLSLYSYFVYYIMLQDPTKIELDNRTKSFAMITHDLKTPLNSISLLAKKLSEKEVIGNVERIESSKMILQSCNMMSELIKNVLFSTKLESGELKLERKVFHLGETFERAVLMASLPAINNGIEVGIYLPELPLVIGDEIRFQQVINNLMGNAVKFTKKGSIIIICKKEINNCGIIKIKVSIEDTGIGIEEKDREKLFKLFSQVHQSDQGTGLGLAICKNLCILMKGDIGITKGYKNGSQFWFNVQFDKEQSTKRRSLSEDHSILDPFVLQRKRSSSFDESHLDMKIIENEEEEENEGDGLYIIYYKNLKVRQILKCYFNQFKIPNLFIETEDENNVFKIDLNELLNKKHNIIGVIIDECYFKDKDLNMNIFNSLKKKFAKHNFELKGREPFYIHYGAKKEKKDFDFYIPKPVTLQTITKMIKEVSNKNKEIKRKSLENSNIFDENETNDNFIRRISMRDCLTGYKKSKTINSQPIQTKSFVKEKRLSLEKNNYEIFQVTPLESYQFPTKKCIVVDDNSLNRKILCKHISELNFQMFEAQDGVEALIKIKKEEIDYVITDIRMPVMDGIQLTQAIRQNIDRNITIIGISGDSDQETMNKCKSVGMNHLLQKPLMTKELNLLKDLLSKNKSINFGIN